jgi:lipopolysaccharide transport system ATP-binding protein
MSARPLALRVAGLSKCYSIYAQPRDRLKQFVLPPLARLLGRVPARYFREFWALRNISFEVHVGETVGIVGRNGSGKSTLLQLLCGTLNPTAGEIETHGRIAALLELGSGFNPEFSGRENVFLNAAVLGLSRQEADSRMTEILDFAEIGDFIDQPIKTYSSGMVVRLAFSVAVHVQPKILVVDEALSVGDERFQRKCFSRIDAIRQSGVTILFVSHSASTVVELCDRALLLDDGELLAAGEPKQIVTSYQKLLYAPAEQRVAVRAALREGADGTAAVAGKLFSAEGPSGPRDRDDRETFDPGLQPTSTVSYESRGARIYAPKLLNARGVPVNHLMRGRRYRYTYRVRFETTSTFVRFGMLIKTLAGLELGGGVTTPFGTPTLPLVQAGEEIEVAFEFSCRLAPAVYFLNAGVVADVEGTETYVHRLIDAAMFRVVPEADNTMTGIVDFSCTGSVKPLSSGGPVMVPPAEVRP